MASTNFIARQTVIEADWLNDVDDFVYREGLSSENTDVVSAFSYLSDAQKADVLAYTFLLDTTAALQQGLNEAWAANKNFYIPSGGYKVTGLNLPGAAAERDRAFRVYGQGCGEIFARAMSGGTILYSTTNAPILKYTPDVPNTGQGTLEVDGIRFEGTSTTPVVHFISLYSQSSFHHNAIYQAGTGDGFKSELSNTIEIHNIYSINSDWNVVTKGASRTGCGFRITQSIETGLTTLRKCTSRGFKDGYILGDGVVKMYKPKIEDSECSVVYNGITVSPLVNGAVIADNYLEGGDQGIGIIDQGDFTVTRSNICFAGFATVHDMTANTYGNASLYNVFSAGSVANSKIIKVSSDGAFGGAGKSVVGNTLTFSGSGGSIAGVVGITIAGVDPRIDLSSNVFDPRGPWVGGAGTTKILDNSTASYSGARNKGNFGFGVAAVADTEYPALNQGSLSVGQGPDITTTVAANTIQTDFGLQYNVTFASATTVSKIADGGQEGRVIRLRVTNGNCTFQNNTNLKLAGGVDWTPGANGGLLVLRVFGISGGFVVAEEVSRTAY